MLRNISISSCVVCCIVVLLTAGNADVTQASEWDSTYGGANDDWGQCVQQTFDGGYIIVGERESGGRTGIDIYLIKTNSSGNTVWTRTFSRRFDDYGECVQQTPDSGYIITGSSGGDAILIKTDSLGNSEWIETYGGAYADIGHFVQLTSDGGYILTGRTYSYGPGTPSFNNVYLVKTDDEGTVEWDTAYGGIYMDLAYCVDQTSDGGYIVTGLTSTCLFKCYNVYLIRTDGNGSKVWEKRYVLPDSIGYQDWGEWVEETHDGGFIIAGINDSYQSSLGSSWLIRTDEDGDTLWTRIFAGGGFSSVHQTSDKGYVMTGVVGADIGPGGFDVYLVKTDSTGATEWTRAWGGNSSETGRAVRQTSGGDYIVAGYTASFGAGGQDVYLNFRETPGYVCGDADSSGTVVLADVIYLINYLNHGGPAPKPMEAGDPDCSGAVDSLDVTYLNNYLYSSGPEPCCP